MQNKKTILITGATGGIGEEVAILFKKNNWNVIVSGRNPEKLKKFSDLGFTTIELDVTNNDDIEQLRIFLEENNIYIDVLLNNAGYGQFGTIEETPIESVYQQFETNFFGVIKVSKTILPFMRKQKNGKIINISSVAGIISFPAGGYYAATKFAIEAISDALRYELKHFNIKVILIEPGPLSTQFFNKVNKTLPSINEEYKHLKKFYHYLNDFSNIPFVKLGNPGKMAMKIYKAANKKYPKNRYVFPFSWRFIKFLYQILPSKVMDAIYYKLFF